jgi:TusA-related sulfurtransferase
MTIGKTFKVITSKRKLAKMRKEILKILAAEQSSFDNISCTIKIEFEQTNT